MKKINKFNKLTGLLCKDLLAVCHDPQGSARAVLCTMERVSTMIMVMVGQGGHGWARFRTLRFFACKYSRAKKVRKGEGSLGTRL